MSESQRDLPDEMPYFQDEKEIVEAGGRLVPRVKTQLESAIRRDLEDILFKFANQAKPLTKQKETKSHATETSGVHSSDMGWIEGEDDPENLAERVKLALEYIAQDVQRFDEGGGVLVSYDWGMTSVLDLGLDMLACAAQEAPAEKRRQMNRSIINQILACMMALHAQGHAQEAFDLARLAGALKCITPAFLDPSGLADGESLQEGRVKVLGPVRNKLKLLSALQSFVSVDEIPSKKALARRAFPSMDDSDFSKMLSTMQIGKLIPNNANHDGRSDQGQIWDVRPGRSDACPVPASATVRRDKEAGNVQPDSSDTREMRKIGGDRTPHESLLLIMSAAGRSNSSRDCQ